MEQGIIKHQRVRLNEPRGALPSKPNGAASAHAASAHRKWVELVIHDARARAIELTCSCGEVTLIELVIDARAAEAERGEAA